jgi:hypothetical protein
MTVEREPVFLPLTSPGYFARLPVSKSEGLNGSLTIAFLLLDVRNQSRRDRLSTVRVPKQRHVLCSRSLFGECPRFSALGIAR